MAPIRVLQIVPAMNAGGMEEFKNRVEYRLYKIKSHFRRRK